MGLHELQSMIGAFSNRQPAQMAVLTACGLHLQAETGVPPLAVKQLLDVKANGTVGPHHFSSYDSKCTTCFTRQ